MPAMCLPASSACQCQLDTLACYSRPLYIELQGRLVLVSVVPIEYAIGAHPESALRGQPSALRSVHPANACTHVLPTSHDTSSYCHDAVVPDLLNVTCRHFAHFAAVVAEAPGQCLRYCFDEGAEPLWPSRINIPTSQDIPACQHCGSARRFEFEVMIFGSRCVLTVGWLNQKYTSSVFAYRLMVMQ